MRFGYRFHSRPGDVRHRAFRRHRVAHAALELLTHRDDRGRYHRRERRADPASTFSHDRLEPICNQDGRSRCVCHGDLRSVGASRQPHVRLGKVVTRWPRSVAPWHIRPPERTRAWPVHPPIAGWADRIPDRMDAGVRAAVGSGCLGRRLAPAVRDLRFRPLAVRHWGITSVAGLPFFLNFSGIVWIALIGHVLYGIALVWCLKVLGD